MCGFLVELLAAIRTLEELTDEYMIKNGHTDVIITTVFHQWMGGFPQDEAKAFGVISWGSATAALSKATKVIVKTPHEAAGVPTMEGNAQGLRCTKQLITMLADQECTAANLEEEKEVIRRETRSILDKCFDLGHADIAIAPSRFNAGKMLPARDNVGAIRILDPGNMPLPKDMLDFNRARIEERARVEKRKASFQMVIDDVYAISKGRLVGRPQSMR